MAGRPRQFDREIALETAMEQFWRHGYEDTTVATLTRAIGITPPSLYAAFGDKDRLFAEAASCYAERIGAALERAMALPTTSESLAQLMRVSAASHTDCATPLGCFVLTEPRLVVERERLRERIAARIERGRVDGDIPAETDAHQLSGFLMAVMAGMSARARDGGSPAEVRAIAELALGAIPRWA
jgi:AcrR family transcriptional regulator